MKTYEKYLNETSMAEDDENRAYKEILNYMKMMKINISKAERSLKSKQIDQNVVGLVMKMSKITDEHFYKYFWS